MSILERKIALETLLQKRLAAMGELEKQRNAVSVEVVKIQGKLELLKELESELTLTDATAQK